MGIDISAFRINYKSMNTKKLEGKPFATVRDFVNFVNKETIDKEDIIDIISHEGMVFLVYYK